MYFCEKHGWESLKTDVDDQKTEKLYQEQVNYAVSLKISLLIFFFQAAVFQMLANVCVFSELFNLCQILGRLLKRLSVLARSAGLKYQPNRERLGRVCAI